MAQGNPGPPGGGTNNQNRRGGRGGGVPTPTGFPTRHPNIGPTLPFRTLNAGNPPTIREHTNRPTNLR